MAKLTPDEIENLKESIDIQELAEELGYDVRPKAYSSRLIPMICPNPKHEDTHATNCYIYPDRGCCVCYACNKKMDHIDLLQYKGFSFPEALEFLAKRAGRNDLLKISSRKRRRDQSPRIYLSKEERLTLGLAPSDKPVKLLKGMSNKRVKNSIFDESSIDDPDGRSTYLTYDRFIDPWSLLSMEAQKAMIIDKCKEYAPIYRQAEQNLIGPIAEYEEKVRKYNDPFDKSYLKLLKESMEEYRKKEKCVFKIFDKVIKISA